ncbi:hypothetical protein THAOC_22396 [Thalassiosira oceanica]|uniref:Uncharacterized protein n=1 Tax=Thalassiosira oceanica TaxID=159749 RepID=K0RUL9_THAOC|nr:hypothetical protein THAOC_22396 [Thalassiosira oceanica]|eukprot:EJK57548.1 hypothetical protein THAOC_22396 [Thalassiosira oceanica]
MYDSLLHLSDTLLGMARKSQLETPKVGLDGMGGEIVQLNVSTSVPEQQTSSRTTRQRSNQTPSPVEMPSLGRKGTGSDNRIRRMCYWCDSRAVGRPKDMKQPRYLTVSTPDLRKNSGSDTVKDVGIYTCYHAAHRNAWNEHATSNRAAILRAG